MKDDMKVIRCDVCVLGSGPSGQNVAVRLAKHGWNVVVVESVQLGGTCALRGCNPKKVLSNAARLFDAVDHVKGEMTVHSAPMIDWQTIMKFKREFTDPVPASTREKFDEYQIAAIIGHPTFQSDRTLTVNQSRIDAKHFVIATGARPADLPFDGAEWVTSSDDFLELPDMPKRVLFVGGGYISMEFAHVSHRCGSDVTVIQRGERIFPQFDPDLVGTLTDYSRDAGIDIRLRHDIQSIEKMDVGLSVQTGNQGKSGERFEVDLVVHGAGRTANIEGLGLEHVGVQVDDQGILVDDTNACPGAKRIYAVGDCAQSGLPPLTPTAEYEGKRLVENLLRNERGEELLPRDPGSVTAVAFTPVPIASVGMSHEQATSQLANLIVNQRDTSTWGSVRKTGQRCAGYKILVDSKTDQIVGAHLLGPSADEQINLFALAMNTKTTATQLKRTLFGYPTMGSDIHRML